MSTVASPSPSFLLNGVRVPVDIAAPQTTLLEFLRARGLTGAKEGCAEGECGSCTVVMVAAHGSGSAYHPINSCLMFLPMAAGREILTVEALAARGDLSEVQAAMAAAGGSQCGYCTPGFVMSLFAEQYRRDREGPCDPLAMAGNLCRCTGYRPIRDAARAIGPAPAGEFRERLARPAPSLDGVAVAGFSRPLTVDGCVAALRAQAGARLVAGATDIGVESNLRHRRWPHLVSVEAVSELHDVTESATRVRIGAALPLSEIAARWPGAPGVLREWLALFASPPIRHRATIGGNLATASPIGDAAPLLLAMDAELELAGPDGRRTVPLASFFTGYRTTVMARDEMITAVEMPKPVSEVRFYKVARRPLDDISAVAAAMAVDLDTSGRVRRARFAFGGVAASPVRVREAEEAVVGLSWDEGAVARVQGVIDRAISPIGDHRASREYRHEVARSLVEKFWRESSS